MTSEKAKTIAKWTASEGYLNGWDRIFGKSKGEEASKETCKEDVEEGEHLQDESDKVEGEEVLGETGP